MDTTNKNLQPQIMVIITVGYEYWGFNLVGLPEVAYNLAF